MEFHYTAKYQKCQYKPNLQIFISIISNTLINYLYINTQVQEKYT